jgi:hypothetical protein
MINFKKIDEKDFVFINKTLTAKEEKEFSDFLKIKKSKAVSQTRSKAKRLNPRERIKV